MHSEPEVWHEAGHALVARWLGGEVRWVTIESDRDDHQGHTEVAWRGLGATELARRSAMVALAGPVAEMLETDVDPMEPDVLTTWRADWDEAVACLGRLTSSIDARDRLLRRMLSEVRAFLAEPTVRERLARVVDALDAHETLDATLFDDALG